MTAETITGTILDVQDHGTIVILTLDSHDGRIVPIYFDHRPFGWLLEGEGCSADDLVGRSASYDGESIFLDQW
jgi:hypothetical protein